MSTVTRIRNDAFEKAAPELAEHAEAIRRLGKRVFSDVIEIGERLSKARSLIAHGHWLQWLETEFGWSVDTAQNFVNVAAAAGKFGNFRNLNVPVSALYLLARRSTPDEARVEIIERSNAGEKFSHAEVRETIAAHQANVLYGQVATPADQEIERRIERLAASAARHAFVTAHSRTNAHLEIIVGDGGKHALEEALKLTADGALTPFQAIIKLLPTLTIDERNRLKLML